MKAKDIVGEAEDFKMISVSFPPGIILTSGADGVTTGSLFRAGGDIYLTYIHPSGTVSGKRDEKTHAVGSQWILDSEKFVLN